MTKTHYEVLEVDEHAGGAKIKRSYYALCKKHHPDIAGGDAARMVAINQAYRVLSDPTLKSAYDRELAAKRREQAFANSAAQATARQRTTAQPAWQKQAAARQPQSQEAHAFRRSASRQKNSKGWAWFMAFGGAAAVIIIAVSYLAPFPQATTATTAAPSVATNDPSSAQSSQTSADTSASSVTQQNTTDSAQTDQPATTDTTTPTTPSPAPTDPNNSSTTNSVSQEQTTSTPKHRHQYFPFWYTQNNN